MPESCNLDPVPTVLMSHDDAMEVSLITQLVNATLSSCEVPDALKISLKHPHLRKNDLDPKEMRN